MFITSVSTERSARLRHRQRDRAEPPDLVLRWDRALSQASRALAAIVDQRQTLALDVLERQRQPAVDLDDIAVATPALLQPVAPVAERRLAAHAQAGARDRLVPRSSRAAGQSKKVRSVPGLALPSA